MANFIPQELLELARDIVAHETEHAKREDREYVPLYLPLDDYNPACDIAINGDLEEDDNENG
jgi:hypothetical protein